MLKKAERLGFIQKNTAENVQLGHIWSDSYLTKCKSARQHLEQIVQIISEHLNSARSSVTKRVSFSSRQLIYSFLI